MKKLLFFGLFLLTACLSPAGGQAVTIEPSYTPGPTPTLVTLTTEPTTVTPTITPSPTLTLTPQPPERFFTEDFDEIPTYWSMLNASGNSNSFNNFTEDSALTFELSSPNAWLYAIYGAFEYESVHIEAHIESRGSSVYAVGLVCNYSEQDGWFEFNIYGDGTYNLLYGQWLADGIARYTPILNDFSSRITTGNAVNVVGLDCYESIVQLYVNDKIIRKLDVARFDLTDGKVGLSLASFEETPIVLAIDWVKVSEP